MVFLDLGVIPRSEPHALDPSKLPQSPQSGPSHPVATTQSSVESQTYPIVPMLSLLLAIQGILYIDHF